MDDASVEPPLVDEIRSAYEGSATAWAAGPSAVYRLLAVALVETAPSSLRGQRVLDLGAGTGVASDALAAIGVRPVAVDLALAMLRHRQSHRPPGVVGDAQALPFHDGAFDAIVAAFSLNHVPDPVVALSECRRVTKSSGLILASTFPSDADHPAKAAVETVLQQFGYQRPRWYQRFKDYIAALTGDAERLAHAAAAAGLTHARVDRVEVEAGLDDPDRAIEWRLNMPHTIDFLAGLDPATQAALRARVTAALTRTRTSSVPMLALRAHAGRVDETSAAHPDSPP